MPWSVYPSVVSQQATKPSRSGAPPFIRPSSSARVSARSHTIGRSTLPEYICETKWPRDSCQSSEPTIADMRAVVDRADCAEQAVVAVGHALVVHARAAARRVKGGGDEIPVLCQHR